MRDYTTIARDHVYDYTSDYTHDYARLCKIMLFDYSDYVTVSASGKWEYAHKTS
jgi:hypothetical protein